MNIVLIIQRGLKDPQGAVGDLPDPLTFTWGSVQEAIGIDYNIKFWLILYNVHQIHTQNTMIES